MKLHAESPVLHVESSCILHDKEFLLYFIWPLPGTLMAESDKTAVESGKLGAYLAIL